MLAAGVGDALAAEPYGQGRTFCEMRSRSLLAVPR